MRILLCNVTNKSRKIEESFPHLGFGYLSSYLKQNSNLTIEIKVVTDDVEKNLMEFKPDLIGLSSVSQNYGLALKVSSVCKKISKAPVIIGGVHITMLPDSLSRDMDVGVIGEGEETFLEIVTLVHKKKELKISDLEKIKGIVFHKTEGKTEQTLLRNFINPLDKLPFPNRSILHINKNDIVSMFSSRGCPYDCTFCASTRFYRNKVRFFSAEYTVAEVKKVIKEYHPNAISFKDDLFVANKDRLVKLVELIESAGINKQVEFYVSCRANHVNDEIAKLLKRMNVIMVSMGLESGSQRILKYSKRGNICLEDSLKAINILRRHNIIVNASFIIGSPDETEKEILETLRFIKTTGLNSAMTYLLTPFPGTPIWDYAKKKNLVSDNMDWDKLTIDFKDNPGEKIILSETLSRKRLFELYKLFLKEQGSIRKRKLRKRVWTKFKKLWALKFGGE